MSWLEKLFGTKPSETENVNETVKDYEAKEESGSKHTSAQPETASNSAVPKADGKQPKEEVASTETENTDKEGKTASENTDKEDATAKDDASPNLNVYHLIVLDESGSMYPVCKQTVDGCNETIQTVRKMQEMNADQKHYVSIYLFQTGASRYILKDIPIGEVRELLPQDYRPSACTPLFDAIGYTLTELKEKLADNVAAYVTIITDGYENDSRNFTLQMVKSLISEMKERNVIFSFIGANIDSKQYGQSMGINNSLQFTADTEGTKDMWDREARAKMRSSAHLRHFCFSMVDPRESHNFGNIENMGNYYDEQTDSSRVSPEYIAHLKPNEIFVFGSNVEGKHDGGASRFALDNFGAVYSQAEGPQGQSYAIPTDGASERDINKAVQRFIEYAKKRSDLTFLVTKIGCGAAHYTPYIIAPMFQDAVNMKNIKLPKEFWDYL